MNCEHCLQVLDLHLDRELDGHTADVVDSHLSACRSCADAFSDLRREHDFYLSHECDVRVAPSFWDGVVTRIAEEKRTHTAASAGLWRRLSALSAVFNAPRLSFTTAGILILFAVGLTVGVLKLTDEVHVTPDRAVASRSDGAVAHLSPQPVENSRESASAGNVGVSRPAGAKGTKLRHASDGSSRLENRTGRRNVASPTTHEEVSRRSSRKPEVRRPVTTDALVREAEQKYVAAIRLLSFDVNRRGARLDPETAAQFRQTLAAVDRTIAGTRRAVREHPGDPVAVQYMLTAYAKKVEVMREMINLRSDDE